MTEDRCRLVLIVPDIADPAERTEVLRNALRGGDVASVIIPQYELDDTVFQKHAEMLVPVIQEAGAAALIVDNSRVAGRVKADGLHISGNAAALAEAVEKDPNYTVLLAGQRSPPEATGADAIAAAARSVQSGLLEYDRRHGYRGPEAQLALAALESQRRLPKVEPVGLRPLLEDLLASAQASGEVSTIGIVYSILAGLLIYRQFDWGRLMPMLTETCRWRPPTSMTSAIRA